MAKDTTHIPPESVAAAARRGLKMREKQSPSNRGGTEVGLARAKQLANREPVSEDTMMRMKSFFARHEVDKTGKDWGHQSKGEQAWLLWGGDSAKGWVQHIAGERLKKMRGQ